MPARARLSAVLETFTAATFQPHVGETFHLRLEGLPPADLILLTATELPASAVGQRRMPFSIEFRGPAAPIFPQATYRLEHAGLGAFDLFLVPVGADPEGVRYEAIFT